MAGNVHHAHVTAIRVLADGVIEVTLTLPADDPIRWRPGQFISLACGQRDPEHPRLRSYSIVSPPGGGTLALVVKLVDGGEASRWFAELAVGAEVRFTGPMGFFVLDLAHAGDVLFGVTGVGIAPILPMLGELLARPERGRAALFWGLREEKDLFWRSELDRLAASPRFHAHVFLTQPGAGWTGSTGRILEPILAELPALDRPTFYLCGNGAMIREVRAALVERGVDRKRQIRTEAFYG